MTPYHAPTTEDFGCFDAQSYDNSGLDVPGDEHGQNLFDFDLAWTFDFLDSNDAPLVDVPAKQIGTVATAQESDDANDWPNTVSRVSQHPLPNERAPTSNPDEEEVNNLLKTWSDASLKASAIDDDLRLTLLQIATADGTTDHLLRDFPTCRSLQYFLLLYIRRVHPRFPAMHIPTFSTVKTPAIVLMAMILAGSCHSVSNGDQFCRAYLDPCRYWLTAAREKDLKSVSTFALPLESRLILCPAR